MKKIIRLALPLAAALILASCGQEYPSLPSSGDGSLEDSSIVSSEGEGASSSLEEGVSSSEIHEAVSSSESSKVEGGEGTSSSTPIEAAPTQADIAKVSFKALPDLEVASEIDLADYLLLETSDGKEVAAASLLAFDLATYEEDDVGTAYALDAEHPLVVTAAQMGTTTLTISFEGAGGTTLTASATLNIVENAAIGAYMEVLGTVKDTFRAELDPYVGVRTPDYAAIDTEGQVVLGDGQLYRFVVDDLATGEGFAVLAPAIEESGEEALALAMPEVGIGAGDIVYDPTFEDLGGSYYLSGDPVDEVMASLGLNGLLTMADGYYFPVALVLKNVTETEIDLVPLLMNYVDGSLVYVNDLIITEIGTAALPYVEEYIESGKIPVADAGPLGDAILGAAEGLNYTIRASGAFYEDGTDTLIADADLPSYSALSDFYAAGKLEREMLFTSDGMYVESCMYDDYGGGFSPTNYGYLNHVDGYVCTFTMEDGVAVMGSKDEDPYFGTTTEAPFYDTYGGNLSAVTLESIEGAGLTPDEEDPNLYHYVYANDINATGDYWYDMSFGSLFMEPLYGDMLSLYLDDSQGRAMMWDMTMDLHLEDDGSISFEIVLPTPIDETTTVDLVIDGSISDIGTTVIPGLSDILDDEPEPSDPWGGWYY